MQIQLSQKALLVQKAESSDKVLLFFLKNAYLNLSDPLVVI